MRTLVLGGTVFLSRAVAQAALAAGHDVTCAARGTSGSVPEGAHHVVLDRAAPDWSALGGAWDAVVDVARTPSWVGAALAELADRTSHWSFVSTISVYADHATVGGRAEETPLLDPVAADVEQDSAEAYGASKVACEEAVRALAHSWLVARPGLIVGPGDPSGRFTYWVERLDRGGEVLMPPDGPTQVIDARDLAGWIVDSIARGRTGTFDTVGPRTTIGPLLREIAPDADLAEVSADFLAEHDVEPWAGPRSLPLWLPADAAGLTARDGSAFLETGPALRPVTESARDTLEWLRATPDARRTGLTADEETALLADWHSLRA